jgi:hypothetical protein
MMLHPTISLMEIISVQSAFSITSNKQLNRILPNNAKYDHLSYTIKKN